MSTSTTNLGLVKPSYSDSADIAVINQNMDTIDAAFLNRVYPVGSIYMSVNSTSPATLFGGAWERITGSFLLAATDNGSSGASQAAGNTGGAATVTLTAAQSGIQSHTHTYDKSNSSTGELALTAAQLPKITGSFSIRAYTTSAYPCVSDCSGVFSRSELSGSTDVVAHAGTGSKMHKVSFTFGSGNKHSHTISTTSTASGTKSASATESHNNMPPYLSVYVWKRTA